MGVALGNTIAPLFYRGLSSNLFSCVDDVLVDRISGGIQTLYKRANLRPASPL